MAFTTYSALKASIKARMARGDVTDAMLSDYVLLAEADLNLSLKDLRRMQGNTTITIVAGQADLPDDFASVASFQFQSAPYYLERVALNKLGHDTGRPARYAIGDKFYFGAGSTPGTLDFKYYKKIPSLAVNDTNWLLEEYPQIYLAICLYHGFLDRRNKEEAANYYNLGAEYITRLKDADDAELSGQKMSNPNPA